MAKHTSRVKKTKHCDARRYNRNYIDHLKSLYSILEKLPTNQSYTPLTDFRLIDDELDNDFSTSRASGSEILSALQVPNVFWGAITETQLHSEPRFFGLPDGKNLSIHDASDVKLLRPDTDAWCTLRQGCVTTGSAKELLGLNSYPMSETFRDFLYGTVLAPPAHALLPRLHRHVTPPFRAARLFSPSGLPRKHPRHDGIDASTTTNNNSNNNIKSSSSCQPNSNSRRSNNNAPSPYFTMAATPISAAAAATVSAADAADAAAAAAALATAHPPSLRALCMDECDDEDFGEVAVTNEDAGDFSKGDRPTSKRDAFFALEGAKCAPCTTVTSRGMDTGRNMPNSCTKIPPPTPRLLAAAQIIDKTRGADSSAKSSLTSSRNQRPVNFSQSQLWRWRRNLRHRMRRFPEMAHRATADERNDAEIVKHNLKLLNASSLVPSVTVPAGNTTSASGSRRDTPSLSHLTTVSNPLLAAKARMEAAAEPMSRRLATAGGISAVRTKYGKTQEAASLENVLRVFPMTTLHQVGLCYVSQSDIPFPPAKDLKQDTPQNRFGRALLNAAAAGGPALSRAADRMLQDTLPNEGISKKLHCGARGLAPAMSGLYAAVEADWRLKDLGSVNDHHDYKSGAFTDAVFSHHGSEWLYGAARQMWLATGHRTSASATGGNDKEGMGTDTGTGRGTGSECKLAKKHSGREDPRNEKKKMAATAMLPADSAQDLDLRALSEMHRDIGEALEPCYFRPDGAMSTATYLAEYDRRRVLDEIATMSNEETFAARLERVSRTDGVLSEFRVVNPRRSEHPLPMSHEMRSPADVAPTFSSPASSSSSSSSSETPKSFSLLPPKRTTSTHRPTPQVSSLAQPSASSPSSSAAAFSSSAASSSLAPAMAALSLSPASSLKPHRDDLDLDLDLDPTAVLGLCMPLPPLGATPDALACHHLVVPDAEMVALERAWRRLRTAKLDLLIPDDLPARLTTSAFLSESSESVSPSTGSLSTEAFVAALRLYRRFRGGGSSTEGAEASALKQALKRTFEEAEDEKASGKWDSSNAGSIGNVGNVGNYNYYGNCGDYGERRRDASEGVATEDAWTKAIKGLEELESAEAEFQAAVRPLTSRVMTWHNHEFLSLFLPPPVRPPLTRVAQQAALPVPPSEYLAYLSNVRCLIETPTASQLPPKFAVNAVKAPVPAFPLEFVAAQRSILLPQKTKGANIGAPALRPPPPMLSSLEQSVGGKRLVEVDENGVPIEAVVSGKGAKGAFPFSMGEPKGGSTGWRYTGAESSGGRGAFSSSSTASPSTFQATTGSSFSHPSSPPPSPDTPAYPSSGFDLNSDTGTLKMWHLVFREAVEVKNQCPFKFREFGWTSRKPSALPVFQTALTCYDRMFRQIVRLKQVLSKPAGNGAGKAPSSASATPFLDESYGRRTASVTAGGKSLGSRKGRGRGVGFPDEESEETLGDCDVDSFDHDDEDVTVPRGYASYRVTEVPVPERSAPTYEYKYLEEDEKYYVHRHYSGLVQPLSEAKKNLDSLSVAERHAPFWALRVSDGKEDISDDESKSDDEFGYGDVEDDDYDEDDDDDVLMSHWINWDNCADTVGFYSRRGGAGKPSSSASTNPLYGTGASGAGTSDGNRAGQAGFSPGPWGRCIPGSRIGNGGDGSSPVAGPPRAGRASLLMKSKSPLACGDRLLFRIRAGENRLDEPSVRPFWIPQIQLHMLATGTWSCLVVVRSMSAGLSVFRVLRDQSYIRDMLRALSAVHVWIQSAVALTMAEVRDALVEALAAVPIAPTAPSSLPATFAEFEKQLAKGAAAGAASAADSRGLTNSSNGQNIKGSFSHEAFLDLACKVLLPKTTSKTLPTPCTAGGRSGSAVGGRSGSAVGGGRTKESASALDTEVKVRQALSNAVKEYLPSCSETKDAPEDALSATPLHRLTEADFDAFRMRFSSLFNHLAAESTHLALRAEPVYGMAAGPMGKLPREWQQRYFKAVPHNVYQCMSPPHSASWVSRGAWYGERACEVPERQRKMDQEFEKLPVLRLRLPGAAESVMPHRTADLRPFFAGAGAGANGSSRH